MSKLRKLKPAVSTVVFALGLTLAGTGIAAAASSGGQGNSAGKVAEHVVSAATCTHLFAVVNKSGVLQRAGCPGITSSFLGVPGHFEVIFPRNVRHCAYVATIGNAGSASVIHVPGLIGVVGRTGNPNGVFVETFDTTGTDTSIGFHLVVAC